MGTVDIMRKSRCVYRAIHVRSRLGLTLMELIVVLALLGIVFTGLVQFFLSAQRSWTSTEVQSRLSGETNVALANISREVRSARKPNDATDAISDPNVTRPPALANRGRLDLYKFDAGLGTMIRVQYRLQAGVLQRGWVTATETAYPYFWNAGALYYPSIPAGNWTTLLTGVTNLDLFTFTKDATNGKLTVRVEMTANDLSHPISQPIQVDVKYTVRGD
jgi:prepilin-type N-terminal cleavage/methylation domain-containing protein